MGPFTGPMEPLQGQPPVGSGPTLTDLMPVLLPLVRPAGMREQTRPDKPTVEPLDFQPVGEQERGKRNPAGTTARPGKTPGNPLEMIFKVVREKLTDINIF